MTRTLRQTVLQRYANIVMHPDGIVPPDYPPPPDLTTGPPTGKGQPGVSNVKLAALIVALVGVAASLGGALSYLNAGKVDAGIGVLQRQLARLKLTIKGMPQWGMARKLMRSIALSVFKKEDLAEDLLERETTSQDPLIDLQQYAARQKRGASVGNLQLHDLGRDARIAASLTALVQEIAGSDGFVDKSRAKVALRVTTVCIGLLTVAFKLFSYMVEWENDPGMVELYQDTAGALRSARQAGVSNAQQKVQNSALYRILRNTQGVGELIPRAGVPIHRNQPTSILRSVPPSMAPESEPADDLEELVQMEQDEADEPVEEDGNPHFDEEEPEAEEEPVEDEEEEEPEADEDPLEEPSEDAIEEPADLEEPPDPPRSRRVSQLARAAKTWRPAGLSNAQLDRLLKGTNFGAGSTGNRAPFRSMDSVSVPAPHGDYLGSDSHKVVVQKVAELLTKNGVKYTASRDGSTFYIDYKQSTASAKGGRLARAAAAWYNEGGGTTMTASSNTHTTIDCFVGNRDATLAEVQEIFPDAEQLNGAVFNATVPKEWVRELDEEVELEGMADASLDKTVKIPSSGKIMKIHMEMG